MQCGLNEKQTIERAWILVPNSNTATANKDKRDSASNLIDKLQSIQRGSSSSTLKKSEDVRIDSQGDFFVSGIKYANLQIQLNGTAKGAAKTSTTIATACVPVDNNEMEYTREALKKSLYSESGATCFLYTK